MVWRFRRYSSVSGQGLVCLWFYLINDAVRSSDYVASDDTMINASERIWKETVET
jgi:hypothetical protein